MSQVIDQVILQLTKFTPELNLEEDASYYVGFDRIILMFFFLEQMLILVTKTKT